MSNKQSVLALNSDGLLTVTGLKDHSDNYQNNATVTLESFVDRQTGDAVTGIVYPLTLPYVAASDGDYQVTIPYNTSVVLGGVYLMTIKAVLGSGARIQWVETVRVKNAFN